MATSQQQDVRQLLLSNMLALGLDPVGLERKFRIPFNRDMFALPNKKGFEVVMYFLFGRLNRVMCHEQFKDCWPIADKKDEQNFRKVCRDWLQTIAREDVNANLPLPRIVASLFMSPGGDKIYQLLFYFSSYVLEHCIRHENGMRTHQFLQRSTLTKQNRLMAHAMVRSGKAGVARIRKQFIEHSQQAVAVQQEWKVYGSDLVKTYRILCRDIRDREQEVKEEINVAAEKCAARGSPLGGHRKSGVPQYDFDVQNVHRARRVRKVRELWAGVDAFFKNSKVDRAVLDDILEGAQDAYCIDAKNFNVRIPDLLLRECEREIQRRNVDNVYQGGKLNLVSLIHLWNLSLHLYIEKLHQIGLPDLDEISPKIITQCHTQQAHLTNTQQLRSKLKNQVIPKLKKEIRTLREKLDAEVFRAKSPDSIRMTSLGLGFMPPTPPINFSGDGIDPSLVPGHEPIRMQPDSVSTPEAASVLMENINQRVRAQQMLALTQGTPVFAMRLGTQGKPMGRNSIPSSKLPRRDDLDSERAGTRQRAPHHAVSHHRSHRAEVKNAGETGTTLHQTSLKVAEGARDAMRAHVSKPPKPNKVRANLRKKPQVVTPVERLSSSTKSSKALDILADQIADVVMLGEDSANYRHVIGGAELDLDAAAFVSKDRLPRTPPTSPRSHDSLEDGRVDKVTTKLFAHDYEENGGTSEIEARLSPPTQRRHHPSGCEDDSHTATLAPHHAVVGRPAEAGVELPTACSLTLSPERVVMTGDLLGMTPQDHLAAVLRPVPERADWGDVPDSGSESNTDRLSEAEQVAALPESSDTDSVSSAGQWHPYSELIYPDNDDYMAGRSVVGAEVAAHQQPTPMPQISVSNSDGNVDVDADAVLPDFSGLLAGDLLLSAKQWNADTSVQSEADDLAELLNASARVVELQNDSFTECVEPAARPDVGSAFGGGGGSGSPSLGSGFLRNSGTRGSFCDVEQTVLQSFISSSLRTLTQELGGERPGRRSPAAGRSRSPRVDKAGPAASELNVADILTKYRLLKENQAAGGALSAGALTNSNFNNNASSGSSVQWAPAGSQPHTPPTQQQNLHTPVLSERYLQQTPTKEDAASLSKRFSLNLDDLEDATALPAGKPAESAGSSWQVGSLIMSPLVLPETLLVQQQQRRRAAPEQVTPTTHHAKPPGMRNMRSWNQQSVAATPLSPVTSALHSFDLEPCATGRLSIENFLNDSAPALLPVSPLLDEPVRLAHPSPPVARLLDL